MANLFQGLGHASLYSQFRPRPPTVVIEQIIAFVKSKISRPLQNALDIGCGSGQSTLALAPYFQQVTGIDVSEAQVKHAIERRSAPNVQYRTSSAESLDFPRSSFDLVSSAQSIHWFDLPKVYSEVERVLVPNGVLVAYGHWIPLPTFEDPEKTKELHEVIVDDFYNTKIGKYWDKGRSFIDNYYRDIELPFSDCVRSTLTVKQSVSTVSDYIGYFSSWSAYQKLLQENPNRAESLLEDLQKRIMDIIEASGTPEETVLNLCTDYFLVMGCKS